MEMIAADPGYKYPEPNKTEGISFGKEKGKKRERRMDTLLELQD